MKPHPLPGEINAAVITRRPELLAPLRTRVGQEGLPADDAVALIDLVKDAITEAVADDVRRQELVKDVEGLRGNLKGLLGTLDRLVAKFTGGPMPEDPDDEDF